MPLLIEIEEVTDPTAGNFNGTHSAWINPEHISYVGVGNFMRPTGETWEGTVLTLVGRRQPVYVEVNPREFVKVLHSRLGADTHEGRAARGIRLRGTADNKETNVNV